MGPLENWCSSEQMPVAIEKYTNFSLKKKVLFKVHYKRILKTPHPRDNSFCLRKDKSLSWYL